MSDAVEPRWRILAPSDFAQLRKKAKDLLGAYRLRDDDVLALFAAFHPSAPPPEKVKLADAQLTLARAHDYPSWPKFKRGVEMFNAISADDAGTVIDLIRAHPKLLHERVNGVTSNWGPPLACSVQVGRPRVFEALLKIPGQDLQWALGRATLKGRTPMARALMDKGAKLEPGAVMGPCESLNLEGLRFLADIGALLTDETGAEMAPVALLLEGYHRDPPAKHACLAFFEERGIDYPDSPVMAFHRGRIDLLEAHLARDPDLPQRRFSYRDIYPPALGCHEDESLGLHGTPLAGTTLLHMAVDFDEVEIARWLVGKGADANATAAIDEEGFGGHTPLFNAVVSQAYLSGRQRDAYLTRFILDRGADPNARASIRKGIRFTADESVREYRDVTPISYGHAFHARAWVNETALALIAERGGR